MHGHFLDVSTGRVQSPESLRDGPDDAQSRARGQHPQSAGGGLLRAACLSRSADYRGHASQSPGCRIHPHARDPFPRTGRWLESGHRRRAPGRRPDLAQLWHVGRVSHPDFHGGDLPVGPSAIAAVGEAYTVNGRQTLEAPRALTLAEIPDVVEQYRRGALYAKEAGFDGVELHGANGYLLDQFLRDGANHRTDDYGGSLQNRARFPLEVTDAVIGVWGPSRVGYKISPYFSGLGMSDSAPIDTFSYLAKELGGTRDSLPAHRRGSGGSCRRSRGNGARDANPEAPVRRSGDRQRRLQPRVRQLGDRGERR